MVTPNSYPSLRLTQQAMLSGPRGGPARAGNIREVPGKRGPGSYGPTSGRGNEPEAPLRLGAPGSCVGMHLTILAPGDPQAVWRDVHDWPGLGFPGDEHQAASAYRPRQSLKSRSRK